MTDESSSPDRADRFTTVSDGPEVELRVRGSRFEGRVLRAASEPEARERRDAIRRRHHDATHHCLAYRLGPPESAVERCDDDGEPSGTAGAPMLAALCRAELFDAVVVVTRWFGGTKLGTGGLARAYGDTARLAVEAAPTRDVWRLVTIGVACGWDDVGAVEALLAREAAIVAAVERSFDASPSMRVSVHRSRAGELGRAILDATHGRARVTTPGGDAENAGRRAR